MEDNTQNKVQEQDNEALIQEMLRDALPAQVKNNPEVIHQGDATQPAPMVLKQIDSAGFYYVWDTITHEKIPILYYMLTKKLRQRRKDGSYQFTTHDPGVLPKKGTYKCRLHATDPDRGHYDTLGFRVCPKDNITNLYQVNQHMKKRHPQEWAAIEDERKERERQEDRALQQLLLRSATSNMPEVRADMQEESQVKENKPVEQKPFVCETCKADFGSQKTLDKHIIEQHEIK